MSYKTSKRLAFHIVFEDSSEVRSINKDLGQRFQHLRFGFHVIQTQSDSTKSICDKDPFFEDIQYYTDYQEFICAIETDITPDHTDVAKVILSKNSFTPLCIQKVAFAACIESLKQSKAELLEESFEAWTHGPVIPDLYHALKAYKRAPISPLDDYEKKIMHARFLQIPSGSEIKDLIGNVSDANAKLTTTAIYDEGHIKDGPWYLTYHNKAKGPRHSISKKDMKDYALHA